MTDDLGHSVEYERATPHRSLNIAEMIRLKFGAYRMMFTPLLGDARRFGQWLEEQAFPLAARKNDTMVRLDVTEDHNLVPFGIDEDLRETLDDFPRLASLFYEMGFRRLELDLRLEANQIEDLVVFLFVHKKACIKRKAEGSTRGVAARLMTEQGVDTSCMHISCINGRLSVTYHYCLTSFSRFVLWFERRNRNFSDHRALFHSAPRYGFLAAVVTLVPLAMYLSNGNRELLIIISILASASLFVGVYAFFMIVGSLEYDNEEKAYKLNRANHKLRENAKKIRADMLRAKTIQEKMLPDTSHMPLPGQVDWAFAFIPETEIGGDYFDVIEIDPGEVAIIFADVSGHGMSAAFITAVLKSQFQEWMEDKNTIEEFVVKLNSRLHQLTPEDSFAAVFVGLFNQQTGELQYFNGGHSPEPLFISANPSLPPAYLNGAPGMIMGILDSIDVKLASQKLEPGDRVLMVTDGIIESANENDEMYGAKKLEEFLQKNHGRPIDELVSDMIDEVDRFVGEVERDDDQTVLAFEIK